MKRMFRSPRSMAMACATVALALAMPTADAAIDRYGGQNPARKLGRGLANMLGGLIEVPVTISRVSQEEGPVAGLSVGLLYGVGAAVTRTVVGAAEILTFPFPLPDIGYGPILLPEFLLNPLLPEPDLTPP